MPVWTVKPLGVEPEIDLLQWRVILILPDGTSHFVGRNAATWCGRVSSAIQEFDARTGEGRTRSGRVYRLVGVSGSACVADYVCAVWCAGNDVDSYVDVTELYEPEVPRDDAC